MTVNTQELRELLEKATPGKWVADGKAVSSDHGHRTSICGTYGIAWPCGSYSNAEADAALIAAARNALPALLAEIDALRRLVDEKFTSGNVIPVERITVTRQEYEAAIAQHRKGEGGAE